MGQTNIYKYFCDFKPAIPADSKVLRKVFGQARKQVEELLGMHILYGNLVYAVENMDGTHEFTDLSFDGQSYSMTLKWVQEITPQDKDMLIFFKTFLNRTLERARLMRIGNGKHFDPKRSKPLQGAQVWPGYISALT